MKVKIAALALIPVLVVMSGCGSSRKHKLLNERVGTLTEEVTRLDAQLSETQALLQEQQAQNQALQSQLAARAMVSKARDVSGAGMYRTPSGFELPSKDIQQALKGAGYYQGPIDGKIGPSTRSALRDFQRDNGLTVDGVCGRETWNKLQTYLNVSK